MAAAIPLAISGISSLIGGGIASSGAQSAANTQSQSVDKGIAAIQAGQNQILPVMQSMYAQGSAGYQPYQQAGTSASSRLSTLMGLTPTQPMQGVSGAPATPSLTGQGTPLASPQNASGGQYTIYAPSGETKQTGDPAEAQFYAKRGLRVDGLNGGAGGSQAGMTPKAF